MAGLAQGDGPRRDRDRGCRDAGRAWRLRGDGDDRRRGRRGRARRRTRGCGVDRDGSAAPGGAPALGVAAVCVEDDALDRGPPRWLPSRAGGPCGRRVVPARPCPPSCPPRRSLRDDRPCPRRDAQHPQPRRPLGRTTAAPPCGHGGARARPSRAAGGRLRPPAGSTHRGSGAGPVRRGPRIGGSASTATASWSGSRWPSTLRRLDRAEPVGAPGRRRPRGWGDRPHVGHPP